MRKSSIALVFAILFTMQAHGQTNGPINGPDACATLGVNCGHGSAAGPSSSSSPGPLSTFAIVVLPGIGGGVGGSFWQNPQNQNFAIGGAAGGLGLGFDAALMAKRFGKKKAPRVLAAAAGSLLMAGSATQAWQFHQAWLKHLDTGYTVPSPATEDKQIATVAGAAAAVTAVVAMFCFHQEKAKINRLESNHPIIRALAQVKISGTLQRMGARYTW